MSNVSYLSRIHTLIAAALIAITPATAQTLKIVHNFGSSASDGSQPWSGVTFDSHGNMFGTSVYGGTYGFGTLYEFSPKAGGGWTEKIVHAFGNTGDGLTPYSAPVIDAHGNLYGMTPSGGTGSNGTAFELSPKTGGSYTETILHNFPASSRDGYYPQAGLTMDSKGTLYGVTTNGGTTLSGGVAFELIPGGGSWKEKILFYFNFTDGGSPSANVTLDSSGNVYGTTFAGGIGSGFGGGLVFELAPTTSGVWTETILDEFTPNGPDGSNPTAPVIFDAKGNLYGSTESGQIFELSAQGDGTWSEIVLYTFGGSPSPSGVVFDAQGNLYGTTKYGGAYGYGLVFELSPTSSGTWTETTLHDFQNNGVDGTYPIGGVTFDASGNLWGTTSSGGAHSAGTVFLIRP